MYYLLMKNVSERTCLYTEKWIRYAETDSDNIVNIKRMYKRAPPRIGAKIAWLVLNILK